MKKQTKLGLVLAAAAVLSVSVASLVSARGWVQRGADWFYVDNDGEAITDTIQSSGTAKFYLGEDGSMQKDYFLEDKDNATYYFGSNGAMVTNTWVAIESSRVENQGDYIPDNYWYYFQASGKAVKGTSTSPKKMTIDGKKYMFNEFGQMCTGWVDESGKTINPDDEENPFESAYYYAGGDNDGQLRSGWVTYTDGYSGDGEDYLVDKTNLYFYFNTSNNKKVGNNADGAVTKKINGRTYAFDDKGVMLSGWDAVNSPEAAADSIKNKTVYFSGEDDGHQVKKGWVYAVPAETVDSSAYGDGEEKYMYFNSSGEIVYDQFKKVNGKYYAFDENGIMKTGLVLWNTSKQGATEAGDKTNARFSGTIDLDWATGEDVTKRGILQTGAKDYILVSPIGLLIGPATEYATAKTESFGGGGEVGTEQIKIHYFGEDGARKTGTNTVEFSDNQYQLNTSASGDKGSGVFSKKYYQLGFLLKASADLKYGIYAVASESQLKGQESSYSELLTNGGYQVLTTGGALQKGASTAKKDADGNYWFIDRDLNNTLRGIWTVNVRKNASAFTFKGLFNAEEATTATTSSFELTVDEFLKCTHESSQTGAAFVNETLFKELYDSESFELTWTKASNTTYGAVRLESTNNSGYFQYQSDYNGGSNKWIPFGVLDDARKTPTLTYEDGAPYSVKPNNDYFLNCYWN